MMDAATSRERLELGGAWQLAFDSAGDGVERGWVSGRWPESLSESVEVPWIWDNTHPGATSVGFYRRTFSVPGGWDGRVVDLRCGGASYAVQAWVNGRYVGAHEGAYTPFSLDVTEAVRFGDDNELVLRVAALSRTDTVDGMVLTQSPASKQSWYYANGGLWDGVALEARPVLSCQAVTVTPDLQREAALIEVATANGHDGTRPANLAITVEAPGGGAVFDRRFELAVPPGVARYGYDIKIPRPRVWSCETPDLYTLRVRVETEREQADEREAVFGMRSFDMRDGEFFLNDEPIFLQGILLQPNYPVTDFRPPDPDMMAREISMMKDAGFNMIRAHLRPAPPGYLDLTDRMGMLVYAESSMGWIRDSPRLLDHCKREMRALVERDRNHASVVIWGVHNENRAASAQTSDALIHEVRALDPTRVIVDNSGGSMAIDQDFGWVDEATVVGDRGSERQPVKDVHLYLGAPIDAGIYEWLRTLGTSEPAVDLVDYGLGKSAMLEEWHRRLRSHRGKIFVSELGCGGMADLEKVVAGFGDDVRLGDAADLTAFRDSLREGFQARKLNRVFDSVASLVRASQELQVLGNDRQMEALLVNRRVSGYILTQMNDVAWEFHAGIVDHWRSPKPAYDAVARLNRPQVLVLRSSSAVLTHGDAAEVGVTLVRRSGWQGGRRVVATVFRGGQEMVEEEYAVSDTGGLQELGSVSFTVDASGQDPCEWQVVARLIDDGDEVLAESRERMVSLPDPDWRVAARRLRWIGTGAPVERSDAADAPAVVAPRPGSLTATGWKNLLTSVEAGGRALIGPLAPHDEVALQALAECGLRVELDLGIGNWMGCYHWIPRSNLFEGLPADGLAGEAYAGVLPQYVMAELGGGEVHAGSFRNTQTRRTAPAMLWYSDIEELRVGEGSVILCQYKVFDQADRNPLAGRLMSNLLRLTGAGTSLVAAS